MRAKGTKQLNTLRARVAAALMNRRISEYSIRCCDDVCVGDEILTFRAKAHKDKNDKWFYSKKAVERIEGKVTHVYREAAAGKRYAIVLMANGKRPRVALSWMKDLGAWRKPSPNDDTRHAEIAARVSAEEQARIGRVNKFLESQKNTASIVA